MKKLFVLLLLLPILVGANDKSVVYIDAIDAADTLSMRTDTVYSPAFNIETYSNMWFSLQLKANPSDTNWVSDTFTVAIEHSFDKKNWILFSIAGFQLILKGANDTLNINPTTIVARDSLSMGNYARVRWIHNDSLEATEGEGLVGNTYKTKLTAWISGVK